ncbi:hypothetical protein MG293_011315 [Ovis ammon polii]|uniref:Uncharacterized protein n=1 Tax=Ovis ammon polii TaxID=230172 RepID=A0AAD4Y8A4_OVIAM|nr:hypothetical protein MG293_011315 [Ovis ammon polii]
MHTPPPTGTSFGPFGEGAAPESELLSGGSPLSAVLGAHAAEARGHGSPADRWLVMPNFSSGLRREGPREGSEGRTGGGHRGSLRGQRGALGLQATREGEFLRTELAQSSVRNRQNTRHSFDLPSSFARTGKSPAPDLQ